MNKILRAFTIAFYSIFIIIIGYIFFVSLVNCFSFLTLLALILFIPGIYIIHRFMLKHEQYLNERYKLLLTIFITLMLLFQVFLGSCLRFTPAFDMDAIYGGAIEWVNTNSFPSYYDYYYYFPNNLGGMSLLYIFFKLAALFGITDFFTVGMIMNSIMSVCAMLVCSLTAKKLGGITKAISVLIFFLLSLPFYFIAPAFYTDSLSLLFPILIIFIALKLRETDKRLKVVLFSILIGLFSAIGMLIKTTVIITPIAVIICLLINKKLAKALICCACSIGVIAVSLLSFNAYFSSKHLTDAEKAYVQNTPYTHWIMMGLENSGGYNAADYEFTRSFTDPEARNKAINAEIVQRIKELGLGGIIKLAGIKGSISMGNGTYALSDFLDDSPLRPCFLHSFLLYSSPHYSTYSSICCGIHLGIMLLAIMSAIEKLIQTIKNTAQISHFMAPHIAFIGITLFLLMWETSGRYITNYIPILFICAVSGPELLDRIILYLNSKRNFQVQIKAKD